MIDINGLIKEFKDMDIDTSFYIDSDLDYTFNIAMDDITKEELDIITKYAIIESIKITENARQFEIRLSERKWNE